MKLASLFLFSFCASATELMSGGASSNGVWVDYVTRLEPGSPPLGKHGGGSITENNGPIKRHLCDFGSRTYFGYDLTIDPLANGMYKLRFAPLTITPEKMTEIFDKVGGWTQLPLPGGPVSMDVRAGETVALDLLVNSSTGQKITDYLTIKGSGRQQVKVSGPLATSAPKTRLSNSARRM